MPALLKLAETKSGGGMPEQCPKWDFAPAEQTSGAEDSRFCQLPLSLFLTAVSPDGGKIWNRRIGLKLFSEIRILLHLSVRIGQIDAFIALPFARDTDLLFHRDSGSDL